MKKKSQVASRKSQVALAVSSLAFSLLFSPITKAQIILDPTSGDLDTYSTPNSSCSSSVCQPMPFALMGDNGFNYDLQYTNSGAFKLEYAGDVQLTWVTDFEMPDWHIPYGSIAHWNAGSTGASGFTPLNEPNTETEKVFDPDVVQLEDQLYSIYYTVEEPLTSNLFPGNGSSGITHRVRFETFTATDAPSTVSNVEIQMNSTLTSDYSKNPNLDVSVVGNIAMVWEEQSQLEFTNHVYAKIFDNINGLSSNTFDLDPTMFEYQFFYNPDVACTSLENAGLPSGDDYVYITFIGIMDPGSTPHLLVYEATVDEIRNNLTPTPSKLHFIQSLPNTTNVAVGNNLRDYLYRPRIAARPQPEGVFTNLNGHQFSIVVPSLNTSPEFSTNIEQFTISGTYSSGFYNEQLTSTPSAIADIDCALNYEPAIDVNEDGYDMIWNNDIGAHIAGYSPNYTATTTFNNPNCFVSGVTYEQTILRRRTNVNGLTSYIEYSKIPEVGVNWMVYSPSVAYDRHNVIGNSTGNQATSTMYAWHQGFGTQESHYRLSTYNNSYLKRDFVNVSADLASIIKFDENQYSINSNSIIESISISDISGKMIAPMYIIDKTSAKNMNVNLSSLPQGIYVVSILSNDGAASFKLIK